MTVRLKFSHLNVNCVQLVTYSSTIQSDPELKTINCQDFPVNFSQPRRSCRKMWNGRRNNIICSWDLALHEQHYLELHYWNSIHLDNFGTIHHDSNLVCWDVWSLCNDGLKFVLHSCWWCLGLAWLLQQLQRTSSSCLQVWGGLHNWTRFYGSLCIWDKFNMPIVS